MNNEVNHKSPLKDIAKQVRAEIKQAKTDGRLCQDTKVSVRTQYYSMGCSLNVNIMSACYRIHDQDWVAFTDKHPNNWHGYPESPAHRYTKQARGEAEEIDLIVRQYHMDRSDPQTDYYNVNFSYNGSGFDWHLLDEDKERVRAGIALAIQQDQETEEEVPAKTCMFLGAPKITPNMRVVAYEPEEEDEPVTWTKEGQADLDFAQLESDRDHALEELEHAQARYDKINEKHQKAHQARRLRAAAEDALAWGNEQLAKAEELEQALCDLPN